MGRKKLMVEEKAEELVAETARLLRKIRYPCKASIDLDRSGDSLLLNLGEGIVAFQPRPKAKAYNIARQEAGEIQKALRALVIKGKLSEHDITVAYDLADHVIGMLTNMIKGLEHRM